MQAGRGQSQPPLKYKSAVQMGNMKKMLLLVAILISLCVQHCVIAGKYLQLYSVKGIRKLAVFPIL